MNKRIISAATVLTCGVLMVTGSVLAYNSQNDNASSTTAGVFNYTSVDASVDNSAEATVEDANVVATAARNTYGYTNLGMAVVEDKLNVRSAANADAEVIGMMPANSACEILGIEGDYYHIKSGEVEGYVAASYIATGEDALNRADAAAKKMATITCDTLMLRSEPSTEASIVANMPNGEKIEVLEELDGWIKASVDSEEGYCKTEYVTIAIEIPTAMTIDQLTASTGASVVQNALQYVGGRYVWGGETLGKGVDCSGFTMKILEQYGVYLPHSADAQKNMGTKVASLSEAQAGDLVFYGSGNYASHVGIYMGDGQIVHASSAKTGIKISNASYRTPIAIRRYV